MPRLISTVPRRGVVAAFATALAALLCSCSAGSVPSMSPPPAATISPTATPSRSLYTSTSFEIPFDIAPPDWLDPSPTLEQATFVTWQQTGAPAVRILAPQSVYRPGDSKDTAVPQDYVAYLLAQTGAGAHFDGQRAVTIDGHPGTVLTATTTKSLDGSLGCPVKRMLAAACFGLQPEYTLRLAVTQVDGRTLLLWLRTPAGMSADEVSRYRASFEAMLAGLRFSTRPVQSATSPSRTSVDGSYRMTISWPKIKTADARCVGGDEGTSRKVIYDLTLDHGSMELWVQVGGAGAKRELGLAETYTVEGHQLRFGNFTADFTADNRALTLTNLQGGECGDVAIFTTRPWTRL